MGAVRIDAFSVDPRRGVTFAAENSIRDAPETGSTALKSSKISFEASERLGLRHFVGPFDNQRRGP